MPDSLLQTAVRTIERHAMFAPGSRAGVAVSGGADSVCLLHVLVGLAPRFGLRLAVLHLDHGLRGEESSADAAFVSSLAAGLGLPCHSEAADLSASPDNLEQAARQCRLAFFHRLIAAGTVDRVATGHTRSDQAETVLFRFLRGSGSAGLAGILPTTAEGLVRPLLDLDRGRIEDWLRGRGLPWREDSSNRSLRFARNRIRHQLLPQLLREWNPSLVATLARTAEWASAEEAYWHATLPRLASIEANPVDGSVVLPVAVLRQLPEAAARRLVRRAIECVKGDLRHVDFAHVQAIHSLALMGDGAGRFQAAGVDALRSFDWVRLVLSNCSARGWCNFHLPVMAPGVTRLPGADGFILMELIEKPESFESGECVYNNGVGYLDWERIAGPLEVRNWRPGDQYRPTGHTGQHKLKDLFQDARIPIWERRQCAVVTDGDGIVWTRPFGPAVQSAAGPGSRRIMTIRQQQGIGTAADGV